MEHLKLLFVDDEEELVSAVVERLELRGIAAVGVTSGDGSSSGELRRREQFCNSMPRIEILRFCPVPCNEVAPLDRAQIGTGRKTDVKCCSRS